MFGRSLWYTYTNVYKMHSVARQKIISGNYEYDPCNKHYVFAVLSFRLALDACLESTISLPLLRTAVGSYMRVVISIDQRTRFLHTTSSSESILAHAAIKHLCNKRENWSKSIDTLSLELLHQGLIEKGLKGELFSRSQLSVWSPGSRTADIRRLRLSDSLVCSRSSRFFDVVPLCS